LKNENVQYELNTFINSSYLQGVIKNVAGFWLLHWYIVAIVLSVLLRFTDSDYSIGILWPLCCLSDRQHNGHNIPME
jgi:hypothetical protein